MKLILMKLAMRIFMYIEPALFWSIILGSVILLVALFFLHGKDETAKTSDIAELEELDG